jgi:hypothetical protein
MSENSEFRQLRAALIAREQMSDAERAEQDRQGPENARKFYSDPNCPVLLQLEEIGELPAAVVSPGGPFEWYVSSFDPEDPSTRAPGRVELMLDDQTHCTADSQLLRSSLSFGLTPAAARELGLTLFEHADNAEQWTPASAARAVEEIDQHEANPLPETVARRARSEAELGQALREYQQENPEKYAEALRAHLDPSYREERDTQRRKQVRQAQLELLRCLWAQFEQAESQASELRRDLEDM